MSEKTKKSNLMSFMCQYCGQSLKVDFSFSKLDQQTYNELLGLEEKESANVKDLNPPSHLAIHNLSENPSSATNASTEGSTTTNSSSLKNTIPALIQAPIHPTQSSIETTYVPPPQGKFDSSLGFVLLGDSEMHSSEVMSRRMLVMVQLFDLLSGQSRIDHPLCQECTDCLLDQLDSELRACEDEYNAYSALLEDMMMIRGVGNSKNAADDNDVERGGVADDDDDELDRELRELEREERELEEEVRGMEKEHADMQEKLHREKVLQAELARESDLYHKDYNEYKRQLYEYEAAQKSVDHQLKYTCKQLARLKGVNEYNLAFRIWHNGHFGTINGLRLGRLPTVPVDWNEINAAWGQTVLLLKTLADDVAFTFQRYRLVPYGNQSRLECLEERSRELPLYGVGGFKFFWDTKFDQAMVAFLDCLQQFKEHLEHLNAECCLPYRTQKGRIEDPTTGISYSIKIQFNSEEQWSKALKFMLTNLKWALVWVASRGVRGGGGVVAAGGTSDAVESSSNASGGGGSGVDSEVGSK